MHAQSVILIRESTPQPPGTPAVPTKVRGPKESKCPMHNLFAPPDAKHGVAARTGIFLFGLVAYALFFVTFLYAAGFVTRLFVPKNINDGVPTSIGMALLINAALLMLFVIQHTIMARPGFKRVWTRIVPAAIERSIYVLLASLSLVLLFWQWRPMRTVVWDVSAIPVLNYGLIGLAIFGFVIALLSSFMVSHLDLFGLRQVWFSLRGQEYRPVAFRLVGFYKVVRHPLMVGFLIAFWATPVMTLGHLFFAAMTTAYIFFGTWIEERDLMAHFGDTYGEYRHRVRGLVPIPKRTAG